MSANVNKMNAVKTIVSAIWHRFKYVWLDCAAQHAFKAKINFWRQLEVINFIGKKYKIRKINSKIVWNNFWNTKIAKICITSNKFTVNNLGPKTLNFVLAKIHIAKRNIVTVSIRELNAGSTAVVLTARTKTPKMTL